MMHASARSNPPYGYKALVIHDAPANRTQVVRTRNFPTREEAIAFAQRWIDVNEAHHRAYMERYNARHANG